MLYLPFFRKTIPLIILHVALLLQTYKAIVTYYQMVEYIDADKLARFYQASREGDISGLGVGSPLG